MKYDEYVMDVTEEDLQKGGRGSGRTCAIARPLRRLPGIAAAEVDCMGITLFFMGGGSRSYGMPMLMAQFVQYFDSGHPGIQDRCAPFRFRLMEEGDEPRAVLLSMPLREAAGYPKPSPDPVPVS